MTARGAKGALDRGALKLFKRHDFGAVYVSFRGVERGEKAIGIHRFGYVVARAHLHGAHCGIERKIAGRDDDGNVWNFAAESLENNQAGRVAKTKIQTDDMRIDRLFK